MKNKINEKIQSLVGESIEVLKANLSKDELIEVKSGLIDVYHKKFSTSGSYLNILKTGKLSIDKESKIEEAFYNIGNLIAIPRMGATKLLKEVYEENASEQPGVPFLKYQLEVIGYVYEQLVEL